jgi:uncharacterized membrane protein YkvA (DUF1232 family)
MTKTPFKTMIALLGGALGILYILNPTAGLIEIIPDAIPFIGNLDEAAAMVLILGCFRYFGIDLTKFFKDSKNIKK